jgi:hypothetical protein
MAGMVASRSAVKTRFLLKLALAKTSRDDARLPRSPLVLRPVVHAPDEDVYAFDGGGLRGEVTIEPHVEDHSGFADLYETVDGLGDSAAWAPTIHTLRVRHGARLVKVSLDLPFGADAPDGALELACAAARTALEQY